MWVIITVDITMLWLFYSPSHKNPPWGFVAIFPKRLGIFRPNFTRLLCVPIYARVRIFIEFSATLTKLCHIKHDHPVHIICLQNVHHRPKRTLAFSWHFPKWLGIFSPNFTTLLNVYIHARIRIFIQLSLTVMKLCHIKCDRPACIWADGGHFEQITVVALNVT